MIVFFQRRLNETPAHVEYIQPVLIHVMAIKRPVFFAPSPGSYVSATLGFL